MLLQLKSFLRKCALPRHKKHCPHMAVAVKRWAPLRAWCRALRGRLSVSYTSEPAQDGLETRSRFDTLVLTLDESEDAISPRTRAKIRDAVELVLLTLQTAPHDAWEQVVRVLCWTQDFYPANHLPTELEPRLCVRHVAYGTFQYDTLDVFASMWATGARCKSYQRTRRWILDNAHSECAVASLKPVPLTLEVTPTLADMARGSTRYLERTAKTVQALHSSGASSTASPAFRLDGIALDLRALDVDASGLSALRKLQQTGVRVGSLAFSPTRPHLAKPDGAFVAMLNDAANPIQRLALDNSSGLAPASVWRALRHARALKDVEIAQSAKGSPAERRLVLQWQAFALLDARSPTSIERVRFTEGSLSRDGIHTMNEVLAAENPSQLLGLQEDDATCEPPREKRLKFLQLMTSPASDDETTAVLQLLGAAGRHLETLAWSVDRCVLKQSHLGALFTMCSQLRRLRLQRAQLQEVDGLLRHYQAGLCRRLESLTLEDSVVLDRPSLLRFLAACNEPRSAVHRTLKDFAYDNYLHESVLAELLPLVEQNASLRYVGLRVTAFGMARHREQLKQLHLAPLAQQHAPLAIESKVAFMGATLGALNSDVCHHIFGFAGEPVRRKVMCFVYDWVRLPNRFEL